MFFKAKHTNPAICEFYDAEIRALWRERDTVKGLAQAIIYHSQPLKALTKDSPDWHATNKRIQETQANLREAMEVYDAHRQEFIKWTNLHQDKLPASYQQKAIPETALEATAYALSVINKFGFVYYERHIKKREKGVDKSSPLCYTIGR